MRATELNFDQVGGGIYPLVILHGLFGSGRNWKSIANQLSAEFTVYLVDLRNHGRSFHDERMDYPWMAADVVSFLDDRGIEAAAVLGHSMGGKVAMWLALHQPDRVHRFIAVDIAPVSYDHDFSDIVDALQDLPVERIPNRKEADRILSSRIESAGLRQFLLQNLVTADSGYCWRINLDFIKCALPHIVAFPDARDQRFTERALFIGGSKSRYLLPGFYPVIHEMFPEAEFQRLDDAGHWPHIDQPAAFLKSIKKFLLV